MPEIKLRRSPPVLNRIPAELLLMLLALVLFLAVCSVFFTFHTEAGLSSPVSTWHSQAHPL
jgi:autotransporter translocation and assembly factor TamB